MNVNETLSQAKTNALGSVGDVVNGFVEFNKPAIQASELALGIISALIMPIGAGQMLSKSVASGVGNLIKGIGSKTKGYEQLGSKQASYVTSKLNDYKVMANQLGFEASTTVEDLLAAAKNPMSVLLPLEHFGTPDCQLAIMYKVFSTKSQPLTILWSRSRTSGPAVLKGQSRTFSAVTA